jgi:predicted PurR-regulated permease PerM
MARTDAVWRLPRTLFVATFITAALYFAQDVFIPLALAALLSFLLSPLVTRLERLGLKRTPSVLAVSLFSLTCFVCLGWILTNQFIDLAVNLPNYKENLEQKLQTLSKRTGAVLSKATRVVRELGQQTAAEFEPETKGPATDKTDLFPKPEHAEPAQAAPTRVTVVTKEASSLEFLRSVLAPLSAPLGKAAIIILLVVFMLIEREELRDRLIRLAGTSHINVTTQALDDAGERVSRYLTMQLTFNSLYGVAIAAGLYFIGVPNALMWGLLAIVLRFLPYLGFWIATAIPFLLALASPGWIQPIATACLFGILQLISNNVEPSLYGTSTGLSSVALLGAALFWAWLWGPVGLLLSTPLTVVLVVMGKHIPHLEFLTVVLGDEPVLEPSVRLYQRMLATDNEEAEDLFEEFTKGKSLAEAYDTFALPALGLAESDYHLELIDDAKRKLVHENMKELVQDLGEQRKQALQMALLPGADPVVTAGASRLAKVQVICFPARDEADEIAGAMLAQVLQAAGASMKTVSVVNFAGEMLEMIEQQQIEVICISAVPPSGVRHARYLYKRIRARFSEIPIVVALWSSKLGQEKARRLMCCAENDEIAINTAEAAKYILHLVETCSLRQEAMKLQPNTFCMAEHR